MKRQSILVLAMLVLCLAGCNANQAGDIAEGITAPIGNTLRGLARGLFPGAAAQADMRMAHQRQILEIEAQKYGMGDNSQPNEAYTLVARFIKENQIEPENFDVLLTLLEIPQETQEIWIPHLISEYENGRFRGYGDSVIEQPIGWDILEKAKSGSNQGYGSYRPLFGQQGYSGYFIYGNDRIVRPNGSSSAWIDKQGNVYGYDGNHLGWYENGCIRGHDGGVMAWQRNAKNIGVIPPIPQIPPIPSIPKIEPIRPIPSIPPIKPIPKLDWSRYGLK